MLRLARSFLLVALLLGFSSGAMAFSLLGPSAVTGGANAAVDSWQTVINGYNPGGGEIGGPMNLGEEYRWNLPSITYAFDQSFLDYFGSNGVAAVESAIAVYNNLPAMSALSANLNEYPLQASRVNFQAQALGLLDLKSFTMEALLEELGMASSEQYTWTLRDRRVINNVTNYFVIQRNFDPVTLQPTPYVNGNLLTYQIQEFANPNFADAIEVAADPTAIINTPVSAGVPADGTYFVGLTRDDIGGLRYSYNFNNLNNEVLVPDSAVGTTQVAVTNLSNLTLVSTYDLGLLSQLSFASTLTPAQLAQIFTNIAVATAFTRPTNILVTNYVGTNVIVSNTFGFVTDYTYANTITNYSTNMTLETLQTIEVDINPFVGPGGNLFITNVLSSTTFLTNLVSGEFYVVPTNSAGFVFLSPLATNYTTNTTLVLTNTSAVYTNLAGLVAISNLDLAQFSAIIATNTPAVVAGLFTPPLFITSTSTYFTNLVVATIVSTFINDPHAPVGSPPLLVLSTNYTTNVVQRFNYTFGNVVTNAFSTNGLVAVETVSITHDPYSSPFSTNLVTNITFTTSISNFVNGSVYIVPTNLFGYSIINTQVVTVTTFTNNIYQLIGTNGTGTGNLYTNRQDYLTFATNAILTAYPIQFLNPTNIGITGPGTFQQIVRVAPNTVFIASPLAFQSAAASPAQLRHGIDKIKFTRVNYDSLLGTVFQPITNVYSSITVTNGTNSVQYIRRINNQPDLLFTAEDIGLTGGNGGPLARRRTGTANWINSNTLNNNANLAGPGVIVPRVTIAFNKVGPTFLNQTPSFLDETTAFQYFIWGSFDGSTNAPIVYPNGTSIQSIEQQAVSGP